MIMDVQELLLSIEGSFEQYHQLLSRLDQQNAVTEAEQQLNQLQDLLTTITNLHDEIVEFRLKKILHEEHPYIPQININKLSDRLAAFDAPIDETVEKFLDRRRDLLSMLNRTPSDKWERTGVHEMEGHVSFKEFVRRMVDKDQQVISQLNRLMVEQQTSTSLE